MTGKTAIEWATATWNPVTGCTRVTEGCRECYAFKLHDLRHDAYKRYGGIYPKNGKPMPNQYAQPFAAVQLLPERLDDPLHVRQPQRFFVDSMSDLFHSEVPDVYIEEVFDVMRRADWHRFLVLTKRAGRLRRLGKRLPWPDNVGMGVSIERDPYTPRVTALRETGARVLFVSLEPLLEPLPSLDVTGLHWIIAGGESGPHARPCQPQWVREIRDKCLTCGVPFFLKQWGGRTPKAGGRLLDGREWNEMPPEVLVEQPVS